MKQIATFFTAFWIFYFPTCIAFNEWEGFGIVDEYMTIILVIYTFLQLRKRSTVKEPRKEAAQYIVIVVFFVLYGLAFGENVSNAVFRDMVQWIRPFSVIYCTWILNPQFTRRQKNMMLYSMISTIGAWVLYHPEVKVGGGSEFPVLGQMAICTGMAWYLWKPENQLNKIIALVLVLTGMLAPKFKFLGEVVAFVYMVFFLKGRLKFKSGKTIASLVVMISVVLYVTWSKFDAYYVSGFQEGAQRMARPETYRIGFTQILWEYFPFGSGMGSWGCAAAADYYSPLLYKYHMDKVWGCDPGNPMFVADAFYPTLCQLGVVGVFFFCVFWKRRLIQFNKIRDMRHYRVAWITFFCLAIEQTADTSFLSGKGMGYCMLIALCLNANRNSLSPALPRREGVRRLPEESAEDKNKEDIADHPIGMTNNAQTINV